MPTMLNRILHIAVLILALAASAAAQNPYLQGSLSGGTGVPGTKTRSALNTMERAAGSLAGVTILTDTFGNQRLALYVHIEDTCINYTPAATGNTNNLSAFVEKCSTDSVWYIDFEGKSQFIGSPASCDQDWLQISDNTCPDNINDSIYHQKYAAIGARLVWPTAELLVSDSTGVLVTVLSGNRNARLGFWDNVNQFGSTIDQSGAQTLWYIEPTGEMRWATAGSGTVQAPGAPFVNQFAINPADSPLPTVQAHLYPRTRTDTASIYNFLYTDNLGKFRSQSIDTLIQIVADTIAADSLLQSNWYTSNGVTTDLGRVAFVKRTAWWRTLDSLGFYRFTNRPDNFNGSQFTIFQDSITLDSDTIIWKSSWNPTLQFHELQANATYFFADSLKAVGIGQFSSFPSQAFDGTEKGFYYSPSSNQVYVMNGNGSIGSFSYLYVNYDALEIYAQSDISSNEFVQVNYLPTSDESRINYTVVSNNSPYGYMRMALVEGDPALRENLFGVLFEQKDTNFSTSLYFGSAENGPGVYYDGRRAFGIRTYPDGQDPFDWIQTYLPNDTTENAASFYNRAYYWKNDHPTGAAGDTLFHFWAATGPGGEAGRDPGFMTLSQILDGLTASNGLTRTVNDIELGGALEKNTSITSANASWRLNITGISTSTQGAQLYASTTGTNGYAVHGEVTNTGRGVYGEAAGAGTTYGVYGEASGTAGSGVVGLATANDLNGVEGSMTGNNGYAGLFQHLGSNGYALYAANQDGWGMAAEGTIVGGQFVLNFNANDIRPVVELYRDRVSGAGAAGLGGALDYYIRNASSSDVLANRITSEWTTATGGAEVSQLTISGINGGSLSELVWLDGDGKLGIGLDPTTDKLEVAGNVSLTTAGNKLKIATGANASVGTSAAMTAGSITISTTAVTANSQIFLTHATLGGTQGILSVGTITAGTSFVINSSNAADTGTVNWLIIN